MIGRTWRILRSQPLGVIATLPFAAILIVAADVALRVLPFRWIAPMLGRNLGPAARVPISSTRAQRVAYQTGVALELAAEVVPGRSDCLRQALAAALIFRCRGVPYVALLGAAVDLPDAKSRLSAHAWVQCGPVVATGGRGGFSTYGVVACFMPSRWAPATPCGRMRLLPPESHVEPASSRSPRQTRSARLKRAFHRGLNSAWTDRAT